MADSVLAQLRSVASFFAARNDDYSVPFIRGMRRTPKHLRARARILDDAELKSVWRAAEQAGVYGRMVRTLLLTAQRREKVVTMKWSAIDSNGVWTIETAEREKSNPGKLQLPQAVLDIIAAQPKFVSNPYVFAGAGGGVMANFSAEKSRLDKASGVSGWVIHDLRRTARSLMSRAGVNSDHAERVLGHAIGGVEQTYDRHPYFREKADALVRLAALVELIINPPEGDNNVIRDSRFKAAS
jgi:integrase